MNVMPPEYVAVQGIGCVSLSHALREVILTRSISGLGHLALQIAKAMGYRAVALSSSPAKESLARQLGAHEYIDGSKVDQAEALKSLGGAKVIMCTAPNADVIQKLMPGLAIDGTLLLLALESTPITVSPSEHHDGSIERVAELT